MVCWTWASRCCMSQITGTGCSDEHNMGTARADVLPGWCMWYLHKLLALYQQDVPQETPSHMLKYEVPQRDPILHGKYVAKPGVTCYAVRLNASSRRVHLFVVRQMLCRQGELEQVPRYGRISEHASSPGRSSGRGFGPASAARDAGCQESL